MGSRPRLLKWLVLIALIAAPASAQTDGLEPVEAGVFAEAAGSCLAALSPAGVDRRRLTADGWVASEMRSSTGGKVISKTPVLSRRNVLLMLIDAQPNTCTLMARAKAVSDLSSFANQINRTFVNGRVVQKKGAEIIWLLADGKIAQFNASGSGQRPGARITIMAPVAEKK